jgi:hypothetical protein
MPRATSPSWPRRVSWLTGDTLPPPPATTTHHHHQHEHVKCCVAVSLTHSLTHQLTYSTSENPLERTLSPGSAYHGLARAAVKVTVDATPDAEMMSRIDTHRGNGLTTVALLPLHTAPDTAPSLIVVRATSPGLEAATVSIPLSTDFARHSVLATAAATVRDLIEFE